MNTILSIETAEQVCSVALHQEGKLLAFSSCQVPKMHSDRLLPMIEEVLTKAQLTTKNLQAVAISSGPGSYTGLRIGVSTAKGIAFGLDIPLIAVHTLSLLVRTGLQHTGNQRTVCGLMDAGRGRAYGMVVDREGNLLTDTMTCKVSLASLKPFIREPLYLVGSGAERYDELVTGDPHIDTIPGVHPHARHMGEIAYMKFTQREWVDLGTFEPLYISAF